MNIYPYLFARDIASAVGQIFLYLAAVAAFLNVLSFFNEKIAHRQKQYSKAVLVLLGLSFLVAAIFHLVIYMTIKFYDPFTGGTTRLAAPLWIENEKLFIWSLLLYFIAYFTSASRDADFRKTSLIAASVFIIAVAVFDNPFRNPLPNLHSEIIGFAQSLSSNNQGAVMASYQQMAGKVKYFYNTSYMWFHPPVLFVSYSVFALSFIACVYMLFFRKNEFDELAYDYGKFGYIMLTVGILLGYPWAIMAWKNEPWWWSPKINMTIMTWVFYSAYLHSRIYLQKKGMWKTTAILGLASFLVLILTYITTYVVPGAHSYG